VEKRKAYVQVLTGKSWVEVTCHRGISIWILDHADPSAGDTLKYMTKTAIGGERFFDTVSEAIEAIDSDYQP